MMKGKLNGLIVFNVEKEEVNKINLEEDVDIFANCI